MSLTFLWPHFCLAGIKRRAGGFRRPSRSTGRSAAGWSSWNKHWRIWIWTQKKGSDKDLWRNELTMSSRYLLVRLLCPLCLHFPGWQLDATVWFLPITYFFLLLKRSNIVFLIMTSISSIWQTRGCAAVGSNRSAGTVDSCWCCSPDCLSSWRKGEAPRGGHG